MNSNDSPLNRTDIFVRIGVVAVLFGGLTAATGPVGSFIAVCVGVGWRLVPGYFAFGFGQIAFVAMGAGIGSFGGFITQCGLWGMLVTDVASVDRFRRSVVREVVVGSLVALGTFGVVHELFNPLWQTILVLGLLGAGCFYGIHRYQLVRMGLVGEAS
jgi:hypothetical protein